MKIYKTWFISFILILGCGKKQNKTSKFEQRLCIESAIKYISSSKQAFTYVESIGKTDILNDNLKLNVGKKFIEPNFQTFYDKAGAINESSNCNDTISLNELNDLSKKLNQEKTNLIVFLSQPCDHYLYCFLIYDNGMNIHWYQDELTCFGSVIEYLFEFDDRCQIKNVYSHNITYG